MDDMDAVENQKAMEDLARMMRFYYEALVKSGFTEAEALRLTIGYQHGIAGGAATS